MRDPLAAQLGFGVSVRGADSACNVGTPGRCGREGEAVRFTEPQRPLYTEYWCRAARSANSSPSVRACRPLAKSVPIRPQSLARTVGVDVAERAARRNDSVWCGRGASLDTSTALSLSDGR